MKASPDQTAQWAQVVAQHALPPLSRSVQLDRLHIARDGCHNAFCVGYADVISSPKAGVACEPENAFISVDIHNAVEHNTTLKLTEHNSTFSQVAFSQRVHVCDVSVHEGWGHAGAVGFKVDRRILFE